jgi:hypothetical protein
MRLIHKNYTLQLFLERRALAEYLACSDKQKRLILWQKFAKLHASRGHDLVRAMEIAKGLR